MEDKLKQIFGDYVDSDSPISINNIYEYMIWDSFHRIREKAFTKSRGKLQGKHFVIFFDHDDFLTRVFYQSYTKSGGQREYIRIYLHGPENEFDKVERKVYGEPDFIDEI